MPKTLGSCPACGEGTLVESDRAWACDHWKEADGDCHFTIWKVVAGVELTSDQAQALLDGQTIGPIDGFTSKAGKSFTASLKLDDPETGHVGFVFAPRFNSHAQRSPLSGEYRSDG